MITSFELLLNRCLIVIVLYFLEDPIPKELRGPCNSIDFAFLSRQMEEGLENFQYFLEVEGNFSYIHQEVQIKFDSLHLILQYSVHMEPKAFQDIQVRLPCLFAYLC